METPHADADADAHDSAAKQHEFFLCGAFGQKFQKARVVDVWY